MQNLILNEFDCFSNSCPFVGSKKMQNVLAKHELQSLCTVQVDDGYVFPLNPVWPVRDKGWWVTGPHSACIRLEPFPRSQRMYFQDDFSHPTRYTRLINQAKS